MQDSSNKYQILFIAIIVALAVLLIFGIRSFNSRPIRFAGSLADWKTTILTQDPALKVLSLEQTPSFYIGVFGGPSNMLFLADLPRNQAHFLEDALSWHLYDTNGRSVDYKFVAYLLFTNSISKLGLHGYETDTRGYRLGFYVTPESSAAALNEATFVADNGTGVIIDSNVLHWPAQETPH